MSCGLINLLLIFFLNETDISQQNDESLIYNTTGSEGTDILYTAHL